MKSKAAKEVETAEKKKTVELFKNVDLRQFAIHSSEDDWRSALASGPQGIVSVKRSPTHSTLLVFRSISAAVVSLCEHFKLTNCC